jgi:hypothetical protein
VKLGRVSGETPDSWKSFYKIDGFRFAPQRPREGG